MSKTRKPRRLADTYTFPGFHPLAYVQGIFGDPQARLITLVRRTKKTVCGTCGTAHWTWYDRRQRRVRDLPCGDYRIYLDLEVRQVQCRRCGAVKRERLEFLLENALHTERFARYVGRRCRSGTIKDVAAELRLDWHTVKRLEKQYMAEQLKRAGNPRPHIIGIDEISVRKGHDYRIVVSDLEKHRPIWFGGTDRSEASMDEFYGFLGKPKARKLRLAVMDMWKAFRNSTNRHAPQAAILFDKFHVLRHLSEALDKVREQEYARLSGLNRNAQLWDYTREPWARKFFENWRGQLKWQRQMFAELIDRHRDGIAAYCHPDNKVALGFVEGLNNKIRVIQRRAYGLHDEEYLKLKILTCTLPAL
jgi:transposase